MCSMCLRKRNIKQCGLMMAEPLPGQIPHRNSFGRSYLNKQLLHMLVMLVTFHGSHMVAPLRCKLGHPTRSSMCLASMTLGKRCLLLL